MTHKSINLSLGKHFRLKGQNTPFLKEFLSVSRKCSSPNRYYLDKLADIWKNLPDSEQSNYSLISGKSRNGSESFLKHRPETPSPMKMSHSPIALLRSNLNRSPSPPTQSSITPEPSSVKAKDRLNSSHSYQTIKNNKFIPASASNRIIKKFSNESFKTKTLMTSPYRDRQTKISPIARDLAIKISKETERVRRVSPTRATKRNDDKGEQRFHTDECSCKLSYVPFKGFIGKKNNFHNLYISCQYAANDFSQLIEYNIFAVMTVGTNNMPVHYSQIEGGYHTIPLEKEYEESFGGFANQVQHFINDYLPLGNILIHCQSGNNRSCVLIMGYLMKQFNISLDNCYTIIKNARPKFRLTRKIENMLRALFPQQ